jgi:hypothetical protein
VTGVKIVGQLTTGQNVSLVIPFSDLAMAERVANALKFAFVHTEKDVF